MHAVAAGQTPSGMASDVAAVYGFCNELLVSRRVCDGTYAELTGQFGEPGVVDLMATMSYYTLVSMALNVDQYPLPEGAAAELMPLDAK